MGQRFTQRPVIVYKKSKVLGRLDRAQYSMFLVILFYVYTTTFKRCAWLIIQASNVPDVQNANFVNIFS